MHPLLIKFIFFLFSHPDGEGEKIFKEVACNMYYCPRHCINNLKIPGECIFGKTSVYTSFPLSSLLKPQQNTRSY